MKAVTFNVLCNVHRNTGWSKSLCAPDDYSTKTKCIRTIPTQLVIWRWLPQNAFGMWTVLHWTRSSRTQFGVSINVWRLAGDTPNITCNFLYCKHQVHTDFLITLYICIIRNNKIHYLLSVLLRETTSTCFEQAYCSSSGCTILLAGSDPAESQST
jgi:hypothetical protein